MHRHVGGAATGHGCAARRSARRRAERTALIEDVRAVMVPSSGRRGAAVRVAPVPTGVVATQSSHAPGRSKHAVGAAWSPALITVTVTKVG
ncbi:hypothetical protein GCM10023108_29380 [Saccharopolyspora hordei]